jgi:uncharacterized protein (DUF2236 family)
MFHLMLPQAFVLQVAHPTIDAGVGEHSVYKTDPWGRIERSHRMLWPVVYARPDTTIRKGVALRAYHRAIKGVDRHGRHYHALEPEAYGWVHMTGFDATVRMHALFGTTLSDDARREAFQEWRRMGLILGLREQDLPATEADYWSHLHRMIDERLTLGAHPRFRSRFQLRWTRWDATWFAVYVRALRLILRLLPERWRYIPQARAAMLDARQNPDAYLWERDVVKRQGGAVPRVLPSSLKGH